MTAAGKTYEEIAQMVAEQVGSTTQRYVVFPSRVFILTQTTSTSPVLTGVVSGADPEFILDPFIKRIVLCSLSQ